MSDKLNPKIRHKIMSSIPSKNTKPELFVFNRLDDLGIKYEKHFKGIKGTPDIAIPSSKKAIFIDGDFWHGFRFPSWAGRITSEFWIRKIEKNRKRDRNTFAYLRRNGWGVIRIWEHQIKNEPEKTITKILNFIGN